MQSIKKSWQAIRQRIINLWINSPIIFYEFKQSFKSYFKADVIQYILIGLGIIACIPFLIYSTHWFLNLMIDNDTFKNNIVTKGQLGDSFGMLNSAISIATCIALVVSLRIQRKQIRLQQNQINEDRILRNAELLVEKSERLLSKIADGFDSFSTDYLRNVRNNLRNCINIHEEGKNDSKSLLEKFDYLNKTILPLTEYIKTVTKICIIVDNMLEIYEVQQENKVKNRLIVTNLLDSHIGVISQYIKNISEFYEEIKPELYRKYEEEEIENFLFIANLCRRITYFYRDSKDGINFYNN